jgi:quercetin dioxygenase-like cupin family protein
MMQETIRIGGLDLRFLQSEANGQGSLTLFEMTIQPNARMPIAHHHETWDETVYGLVGVSMWRVDGEDILLRAGETVFIKRGVVHAFRNDTEGPATCLCVLTPGALGPAYFREMAALVAAGAPDPAQMKATMLRYGLVPVPGV